jgi:hypothetical protein
VPEDEPAKATDAEYGSFEPVKKGVYSGGVQYRRFRVGSAPVLHDDEPASHHAVRETQRQCDTGVPYPHGLDVLEHTYYLDYKNDRAKFKRSFWTIVNWVEIHKRLITDLKK